MSQIKKDIYLAITFYMIVSIYLIIFHFYIEKKNNGIFKYIKKIHRHCIYECKSEKCNEMMNRNRGEAYFVFVPIEKQKDIRYCIITFWHMTHLIFYFILGYFIPSLYMVFFVIGIIFEYLEHKFYDCDDPLDILFNTVGLLLGRFLSPYNK